MARTGAKFEDLSVQVFLQLSASTNKNPKSPKPQNHRFRHLPARRRPDKKIRVKKAALKITATACPSTPAATRRLARLRLGAALAVRVRAGGAGVRVRVGVVLLRQALLPQPPVGDAQAGQQALVVKAPPLLSERVLRRETESWRKCESDR